MDNTNRHSPSGVFMALIGLCAFALLIIMLYGFVTSNLDFIKSLFGAQSDDYAYSDVYGGYGDNMYSDGMYGDGNYLSGTEGAYSDGTNIGEGGAIDDSMLRGANGTDAEPTAEPDIAAEPAQIGGTDSSAIDTAASGVIAVG